MKRVALAALVLVVTFVLVGAGPVNDSPTGFGYHVEITPDNEFADFYEFELVVFDLATNERVVTSPKVSIHEGGSNRLRVTTPDRAAVELEASVADGAVDATYELLVYKGDDVVASHGATVRLQRPAKPHN